MAADAPPPLVARDVAFAYGGAAVLRGISLEVRAGELLGLLGPNGSGKTTLLRCFAGFLRPSGGEVTLDGIDVAAHAPRARARRIAVVPQEMPTDVPLRVAELALLGRLPHLPAGGLGFETDADRAAATAALAACDVAHLAGRALHELSGGELRRAFVARALAQDAAALLLDEPTAGLDLRHQLAILELLKERARAGAAVLAVLHDANHALAYCDRVALLDRGAAVATGVPEAVLTPGRLRDVYAVEIATAEVAQAPHNDGQRRVLVAIRPISRGEDSKHDLGRDNVTAP